MAVDVTTLPDAELENLRQATAEESSRRADALRLELARSAALREAMIQVQNQVDRMVKAGWTREEILGMAERALDGYTTTEGATS